MSDVVAESVSAIRLADPKPACCTACLASADVTLRFVKFYDLDHDGPKHLDPVSGAVVEAGSAVELCENCVRAGAEVLELKPDLHARQFRALQQRELTIDYWRKRAKKAESEITDRDQRIGRLEQDAGLVTRRRKQAA